MFDFAPRTTSWATLRPSPFDKLRAGSSGLDPGGLPLLTREQIDGTFTALCKLARNRWVNVPSPQSFTIWACLSYNIIRWFRIRRKINAAAIAWRGLHPSDIADKDEGKVDRCAHLHNYW